LMLNIFDIEVSVKIVCLKNRDVVKKVCSLFNTAKVSILLQCKNQNLTNWAKFRMNCYFFSTKTRRFRSGKSFLHKKKPRKIEAFKICFTRNNGSQKYLKG
jgi:hypothetical protein